MTFSVTVAVPEKIDKPLIMMPTGSLYRILLNIVGEHVIADEVPLTKIPQSLSEIKFPFIVGVPALMSTP